MLYLVFHFLYLGSAIIWLIGIKIFSLSFYFNYQMMFHENSACMLICSSFMISLFPWSPVDNSFVSFCFLWRNRFFNEWLWLLASDQFWSTVARAFGSTIKRIAFEGAIKNDDFRSPTTRLVLGNDPWIHLIEARGNIDW